MAARFNPLDYPACLTTPDWAASSPWAEHAPFVLSLIDMVRPRVAVGLGDHGARYGECSDALPGDGGRFADGTIDLLLLDGPGDFRPWLPKMSDRGVLLLRGREPDSAGLGDRTPFFTFTHGRGLTVVAVGSRRAPALDALLAAGEDQTTYIREFYYQLGRRLVLDAEVRRLSDDGRALRERLGEAREFAEMYRIQCDERDAALRRAMAELEPIRRSLALRFVGLLARLEWALAPAGSRRRDWLHAARNAVGALRRRAKTVTRPTTLPRAEPAPQPRPALSGPGPALLMVTHEGGGGTGRHVRDMAAGLEGEGVRVLLLCPAGDGRLRLERYGDGASGLLFDPAKEYHTLQNTILRSGCVHVHVQHLLRHPPETQRLTAELGLPYDVTIHDYHYACPRIHLHDEAGRYCGEPAAAACNACLARNGDFLGERVTVPIAAWRRRHAGWLAGARRVFVPHAEVGRRMARYFPHVRFHERPHPEIGAPVCPPPAPPGPAEPLRVGLLGVLAAHKGADVLMECARDAEARRLPLRFEVIGKSLRPVHEWPANVAVAGEYREDEVFDLIRARGVHCALFLSIVPETYSYTLSIAQAAGLYPLGFDLGAIGARIRESGWGDVFPPRTPPDEINDRLLAAASRLREGAAPPPRVVRRYESLTRDYYGLDLAAAPVLARGRAA